MKISVAISSFAAKEHIALALTCVAAQTHLENEVAIVCHGPADGTEALVRRFKVGAAEPIVERLPEHSGSADALNRLVELATGDAIAFLDPRDTWMPRHVAIAVQQLSSGADVVVSDARLPSMLKTGAPAELALPKQVASSPLKTIFSRDVIPALSCVVLKRSMAVRVGLFDSRFAGGGLRDFLLRCALAGARFAATHRATCRIGAASTPSVPRALRRAEEATAFFDKHRDLAAVPAALRRRLLAASLVDEGRLLRRTDPAAAARCFWRAWSLQPMHVQTLGQFALTGIQQGAGAHEQHAR